MGTRIVMMHRGQVAWDVSGGERKHVRPDDLLARFEALRRRDQLDEGTTAMLRRMYV
jgi:putative ABC transport system ATP-binding protein